MSAKISGAVWDLELSAAHLLVLLALADHADHNGNNVYPSMGLVAWKTGYSVRQVKRIVKQLTADKLLIAVSKTPGKVTKYRINLAAGKTKAPFETRDILSPLTGDILSPTSDIAMSPEPSLGSTDFVSVYHENFGLATGLILDNLKDLANDYTAEWLCDAMKEAVKAEKRSLKYVAGILANWKRDGRNGKGKSNGKGASVHEDPLLGGLHFVS